MRILFLDDDYERLELAKKNFDGHDLYLATTVKEAINCLEDASPFDMVYLDHDLGGKQMVESGESTGYEVAEFIKQMPKYLLPKRVIIHSFNPVGALNMLNLLKTSVDCLYVPFNLK